MRFQFSFHFSLPEASSLAYLDKQSQKRLSSQREQSSIPKETELNNLSSSILHDKQEYLLRKMNTVGYKSNEEPLVSSSQWQLNYIWVHYMIMIW